MFVILTLMMLRICAGYFEIRLINELVPMNINFHLKNSFYTNNEDQCSSMSILIHAFTSLTLVICSG